MTTLLITMFWLSIITIVCIDNPVVVAVAALLLTASVFGIVAFLPDDMTDKGV